MSVRMQSVTNAHNAARRISGGGRPSIKQSGALDPLKPSSRSSSGLTISSQRVKGNTGNTDKTPELPPINPQVNRELEALKGRVAQLTEELSLSRREAESAREAAAAESTRANRAQKLADKDSAARAELSAKAAETEEAASHLRAELQRLQHEPPYDPIADHALANHGSQPDHWQPQGAELRAPPPPPHMVNVGKTIKSDRYWNGFKWVERVHALKTRDVKLISDTLK